MTASDTEDLALSEPLYERYGKPFEAKHWGDTWLSNEMAGL
jgi:hypothetical protein